MEILRVDRAALDPDVTNPRRARGIRRIGEIGDWLATTTLPITEGIGGRNTRINLDRLRRFIADHPFTRTGIHVVDADGAMVFGTTDADYDHDSVLEAALHMLETGSGTIAVGPYELQDGSVSLVAIVVPRAFP